LKKRIGFGQVNKIKKKQAVIYIISNLEGRIKIVKLINGKLRTPRSGHQFNENAIKVLNERHSLCLPIYDIDSTRLIDNYWFAGFSDADGSFQIKTLKRKERKLGYEVRLNYQIDQKGDGILALIKEEFGGYLGFRKSQNTFYWGSINFSSAYKLIKNSASSHLMSSKYINYLKWRKVYCMIQEKSHLTTQ
jgi:hypothetical protein